MNNPKYILWPHLKPQPGDVALFEKQIEQAKAKGRTSEAWLQAAAHDLARAAGKAIANQSTGENEC